MSLINHLNEENAEHIQTLWSGYGSIKRYPSAHHGSLIVKHIKLPDHTAHPRGWNTDRSHQRKIRSYHVESTWYGLFARQCDERCRVPQCFEWVEKEQEFLLVMEDLDLSGYPARHNSLSPKDMLVCLDWLAYFHARFMGQSPRIGSDVSLWDVGTYWHLATRPDELQALDDAPLKSAASAIDQTLNQARYQTFVHGDAKLANFCFSKNGESVAAVDFQYVGGGCGMKDVAYFIGSCLFEDDCERYEQFLLKHYFAALKQALIHYQSTVNQEDLEQEWRALFPFAWADFHRFMKGWSPCHWKINAYSERLSRQVIQTLDERRS